MLGPNVKQTISTIIRPGPRFLNDLKHGRSSSPFASHGTAFSSVAAGPLHFRQKETKANCSLRCCFVLIQQERQTQTMPLKWLALTSGSSIISLLYRAPILRHDILCHDLSFTENCGHLYLKFPAITGMVLEQRERWGLTWWIWVSSSSSSFMKIKYWCSAFPNNFAFNALFRRQVRLRFHR